MSAERKPPTCVPPSWVLMLLTNDSRFSAYESLYWNATSTATLSRSRWNTTGLLCSVSLFVLRNFTNSVMPPLARYSADLSVRSSYRWIVRPLLRNASSRRREATVSHTYSVFSKIVGSGWKRTVVPLPFSFLSAARVLMGATGMPRW